MGNFGVDVAGSTYRPHLLSLPLKILEELLSHFDIPSVCQLLAEKWSTELRYLTQADFMHLRRPARSLQPAIPLVRQARHRARLAGVLQQPPLSVSRHRTHFVHLVCYHGAEWSRLQTRSMRLGRICVM